jgi:UDP-N-acetyl-2-amino-2-deoxyglucuronate dehydrogenase
MKKNKKIKFGLLGLGNVVQGRVKNLFTKELKNCSVKAVFDKDKKKIKEFSKYFNCSETSSEKLFFKQNFKICYISNPSGSHFKDILKCFKNNKHVVVEKPPVLKIKQLLFLSKFAKRKKLNFFVIYQNRENKSVKFVKKFLNQNKNDKIVLVNLNLLWSRPQKYYSNWHGKWKHDGGVIAQQGIHYIDLLCYFFGKPIKAVSLINNVSNKLEAEDTHVGLIKFKNANCTIGLTTALRPNDLKASIEIYCQKKIIRLSGLCCNNVSIENYDKSKFKYYKKLGKNNSEKVINGMGNSHLNCFDKIVKKLQNKTSKPLKAIETIDTLKLINMLYRSSSKAGWIKNNKTIINSRLGN